MSTPERVVILGASDRPDRYAHKAMKALLRHGHEVVLVHPRHKEIEGRPVLADVGEVTGPVDTVTMYVGPAISAGLADKLMALKPRRVIFNPGSENPELQDKLENAGIRPEEACTLVMLATGQY
ncbi:CoA-binding protein [Prosthecobacter sp. SYSU 5D2]|uniref:CoA-binding protein n=1 Tax=Prosthecobacter sp. SYSU 5D2 TaxID=3134134 RepID=UPI0031FEFB65